MAKSPNEQLTEFIAKYSPEIQGQAHAVLAKMRERLPNAVEMVYDSYNALVCGFSPTEKPSEAVFSIVLYPRYIAICFIQGAAMPDPHGILQGKGNQVRWIRLSSPADLDRPDVVETMDLALAHAQKSFDPLQPRQLTIRSISAKQRPRISQ